eukprot:5317366-Lingulodinium_polyedra.AAC.1
MCGCRVHTCPSLFALKLPPGHAPDWAGRATRRRDVRLPRPKAAGGQAGGAAAALPGPRSPTLAHRRQLRTALPDLGRGPP